jgi:Flp pilus assembly protein TadG
MTNTKRNLTTDQSGAAAVEFSLIVPAFLVMLLGVFQIGIWMQSYNAMRNSISETGRNVSVEFQTDNRLSNSQIQDFGLAIASTTPYMLDLESTKVLVDKDGPPVQSIPGTRKMILTMTHQLPSFLSFAGIDGPELTYSRAVFVAL